MHCLSSEVQNQLILLLYIFPSLGKSEKTEKMTTASSLSFWWHWRLFQRAVFLDKGLKIQQGTVQLFWSKIKFEAPLTSKATSGYIGQSAWNWIKGNVPRFEKIHPDANKKNFMWITCGSRYISASCPRRPQEIGTCGGFCLHLRVILPAKQITCGHRM